MRNGKTRTTLSVTARNWARLDLFLGRPLISQDFLISET